MARLIRSADAEILPVSRPVTLELTSAEASALRQLLASERWPANSAIAAHLNEIHSEFEDEVDFDKVAAYLAKYDTR